MKTITKENACFPAGTRVMTDKGLVPIESIKVGDKVLSKPEDNTGEAEFKPVLKKFVHDNKELWALTYVEIPSNTNRNKLTTDRLKRLSKRGKFTTIKATPNHPFWVEKEGWTRLDHLQYGHIIQSKKDGVVYMVFDVSPVLQTNIESVTAQSSIRNILDADKKGEDIDDVDYYDFAKYGNDGYIAEFLNDGHDSPSPLNVEGYPPIEVSTETYRTTVYNFEVADHHTYYVWDLWVHNTNCDDRAPKAIKKIYNQAFDVNELKLETKHNACFVAGTLVHTDKGLVPIQDIKAGDMVLSRPEWGGIDAPTEYKRVVRAFCSGEEEIVRVSCQKNSEYGDPDALRYFEFMTPNHPIWDETLNDWIPASNIEIGTLLSSIENEDNLRVLEVDMVWDSYTKGIGITYPIYSDESEVDFMVAFNNQGYKVHSDKFISDYYISDAQDIKLNLEYSKEVFKNYENKSWAGNRKPIKVPVYNLEVESFHTYFVGEQAIWVHNDNCFYEYDPNLTFANAPLPDTIKFNSHTCFPAGTLVHTDKGLVPIQDIKVGDMVLSRPEWGGRDAPTEYKRVVRAFCSGEEEIVRVSCVKSSEHAEDYPTIYTEFMTPQHPVWIESLREWLPVSDVILQWKKRISIEDIHNNTTLSSINNNDNLMIIAVDKIWDSLSTNEKIGIAPSVDPLRDLNEIDMIISFEKTGYKVDYDKYNSEYYFPEEIGFKVDDDVIDNYQSKTWAGNSAPIKIPVYNLEIEDYHTYFIGEHGVWVHNCGGE